MKAIIPIIQEELVDISLSNKADDIPLPTQFRKPIPIPTIPAMTITTANKNIKNFIRFTDCWNILNRVTS